MDDSEILPGSNGTTISVHAGFPNPAAERTGAPLSLDKLLIHHPSSTYFFRIRGQDWQRYGVFDNDLALIDRSLSPLDRDLVVWWQASGELCLGRYKQSGEAIIWGVVTAIVHSTRKVTLHGE